MRFLLDVNVGTTIARALVAAGHDVLAVASADPRAEDKQVFARAVLEQRVLVTYDSDFSALIFGHAAPRPPAVIYIRFEPLDVADVVPRLLPLLDFDRIKGHMIVIDERRTRSTPFPMGTNDNG